MEYQQKYYHGHLPAQFTVMDIYGESVHVERIDAGKLLEGGVLLNGQPVRRIFIENDKTIVLMTAPRPIYESTLTPFYFDGSQFWDILHRDEHSREQPHPDYAGALEAQLAYIRQMSNNRDEEMPYTYHVGGIVIDQ